MATFQPVTSLPDQYSTLNGDWAIDSDTLFLGLISNTFPLEVLTFAICGPGLEIRIISFLGVAAALAMGVITSVPLFVSTW
jgi:hypothetical protein